MEDWQSGNAAPWKGVTCHSVRGFDSLILRKVPRKGNRFWKRAGVWFIGTPC